MCKIKKRGKLIMLYEMLTDKEIVMIETLRRMSAEESIDSSHWVDTKTFLRYWEEAKGYSHLFKDVFNEQLILRRKVNIVTGDDEIQSSMDCLYWSTDFTVLTEEIMNMLEKYQNIYGHSTDDHHTLAYYLRNFVFSIDALLSNRYEGKTIELTLPDNSIFKLSNGAKLMKALGRLAKAADIYDTFERVRLSQSQILNQAHLDTELCLSIHPLDYITASYNANDWHSCMCWDEGEYRRGVIEMMNSPYVVVAYTPSAHEKLNIAWNGKSYENWNSKKWREFFIIDPNSGIYGIKGYPYWNRELEDIVLHWLAELAAPIFPKGLQPQITKWETGYEISLPTEETKFCIGMSCGPAMYNDFYNDNYYHAIFSNSINYCNKIYINYSGASECVCCGKKSSDYDSESDLVCNNCEIRYYCEGCGERIYPDDAYGCYQYHERWYCESCFDRLPICDICEEPYDDSYSEGIDFVVCAENIEHSNNVLIDNYGSPVRKYVCENCSSDVFVDGLNELTKSHWWYPVSPFDYCAQIHYSKITKQGMKDLYEPKWVENFMTFINEENLAS